MLKICKMWRMDSFASIANIRFGIAIMIYETYFSDIVRHSSSKSVCKMRMHLRKKTGCRTEMTKRSACRLAGYQKKEMVRSV